MAGPEEPEAPGLPPAQQPVLLPDDPERLELELEAAGAADPVEGEAEPPEGAAPDPERHRMIALRARSATATDTHLLLDTAAGSRALPWSRVEFMGLGIIDHFVGMGKLPRSGMMKTFRKMFLGDGKEEDLDLSSVRRYYLLDFFLAGHRGAFRIDSSHFNYKSILPRVGYISVENFRRLVEIVLARCPRARLSANLSAFCRNQRDAQKPVKAVYDFEQVTFDERQRLDELEQARDCLVKPPAFDPEEKGLES